MSAASEIAAEVAAGLGEAGEGVGDGTLIATLLKPGTNTGPEYAPVLGAPTEHPLTVVLIAFSDEEREGTLIEATDLKVLADATGAAPTVADKLVIDDVAHTIHGVTQLAPAGIPLMYTIWARN